jgi:hypothetical protein
MLSQTIPFVTLEHQAEGRSTGRFVFEHLLIIEQMFEASRISGAAVAVQSPQQKGDLRAIDQILHVPHIRPPKTCPLAARANASGVPPPSSPLSFPLPEVDGS